MPSVAAFVMVLAAARAVLASPLAAPVPTPAPSPKEVERAIQARAATCTFSGTQGYSSASASKSSCSTIILDALTVPAGVTLDMTDLPDDTVVIFEGETTFAYEEWDGPLFAVSGTNIKVAGTSASSSILNGNGAVRQPSFPQGTSKGKFWQRSLTYHLQDYWDGEGSNGGKTKPKFFQAHDLTDSLIETLTILNPPVQVFSIDGASNLELAYISRSDILVRVLCFWSF